MTEKEFLKLKVGDKVRIVSVRPETTRNDDLYWSVLMDKYLGKVLTINALPKKDRWNTYYYVTTEEAAQPLAFGQSEGWYFSPRMIAEKVKERQTIVIKRDGLTVTAYCGDKKGVAHCNPDDEFDLYTGAKLALNRAFGREEKLKNPNVLTVICTESKRPDFTKGMVYVRNLAGNLYDDYRSPWSLSCMFDDPTKWTISDARFELYEG